MSKGNPKLDALMAEKGWLTVKAASERAGVSGSTVYRWLDEGALVEKKVGERRYIGAASLDAKAGLEAGETRDDALPPEGS